MGRTTQPLRFLFFHSPLFPKLPIFWRYSRDESFQERFVFFLAWWVSMEERHVWSLLMFFFKQVIHVNIDTAFKTHLIEIYTLNVYIKIGARPPVLRRKHDLNNFRKETKIRFHEEKISPTNGTFSSKKCLLRNCLLGSSGGPGEGCSHWACIWRQSQVNFVTK